MSLEPPVGTVGRREDHGVNTVTSQDIPKKLAGKFMVNLVIGSHHDYPMTEKVEPMLLQLQMTIDRKSTTHQQNPSPKNKLRSYRNYSARTQPLLDLA